MHYIAGQTSLLQHRQLAMPYLLKPPPLKPPPAQVPNLACRTRGLHGDVRERPRGVHAEHARPEDGLPEVARGLPSFLVAGGFENMYLTWDFLIHDHGHKVGRMVELIGDYRVGGNRSDEDEPTQQITTQVTHNNKLTQHFCLLHTCSHMHIQHDKQTILTN